MCSIDLSREHVCAVAPGGGQLRVFPVHELREVTLGRDQQDWVELVLDLGEAEHSHREGGRAHQYYSHSEGEASITTSHNITAKCRKSFSQ